MSKILEQIRWSLKFSMTAEVKLRKMNVTSGPIFETTIASKDVSRAIISMFPEIGKKPDEATDDDVIKLLKKYINQEKERAVYELGYLKEKDVEGKTAPQVKKLVSDAIIDLGYVISSNKIFLAELFLPKQASEEEVTKWIAENIDFTTFKNKMQAMGPIMKQFKGADGNFIKGILMKS
jgi:uncharacterized protein YqeY